VKYFIVPLPDRYHRGLIDRFPQLRYDFWLVEHQIHQLFQHIAPLTDAPDEADYCFVPFYSACLYASMFYERNISVANPPDEIRAQVESEIRKHFSEILVELKNMFGASWQDRRKSLIYVFGQGRGANQSELWTHFPELRSSTFLGVEGRPPQKDCFSPRKDLVIPAYVPHEEILEEVRREQLHKDFLVHFRGRAWGEIRPAVIEQFADCSFPSLVTTDVCYRMGREGDAVDRDQIKAYYREMSRSIFCLCPAGHTPWALRFYEAFLLGCIPVLIPGTFIPPFQDQIDYESCTVTCAYYDLPKLPETLSRIPPARIEEMQQSLSDYRHLLSYRKRSDQSNAGDLILDSLATMYSQRFPNHGEVI